MNLYSTLLQALYL